MLGQARTRIGSPLGALVTFVGLLFTVGVGAAVGRGYALSALMGAAAVATLVALVTAPQWIILAGGAMVYFGGVVVAGVPVSEIGLALIVVGSVSSRRQSWRVSPFLPLALSLLAVWVSFVALLDLSNPSVSKRALSLSLWGLVILALALPGATRVWVARGLLLGLLFSFPGSVALGSTYGSRWAGFIGDPNAFAMTVAITVPLISYTLTNRTWKMAAWPLAAVLIVFADSRTGMMAISVAAIVFLLAEKLRYWTLGIPVLALLLVAQIPDSVVRGGRWEERLGSDELRERIAAAAQRQIEDNLLAGRGLGAGSVDLSVYGDPPQSAVFFLHSSYTSMVTEIGVVGLITYALLVAGAVFAAIQRPVDRGAIAAIAGAAAMSTQLGEVLFAVPMALALGYAWGHRNIEISPDSTSQLQARDSPSPDSVVPDPRELVKPGRQVEP